MDLYSDTPLYMGSPPILDNARGYIAPMSGWCLQLHHQTPRVSSLAPRKSGQCALTFPSGPSQPHECLKVAPPPAAPPPPPSWQLLGGTPRPAFKHPDCSPCHLGSQGPCPRQSPCPHWPGHSSSSVIHSQHKAWTVFHLWQLFTLPWTVYTGKDFQPSSR